MNIRIAMLIAAASVSFVCTAKADTITTDLGVTFDGVVAEQPDGTYKITAGENVLIYRKEEIVSIEKNDRNGKLDLEAIAAEAKLADERLTKETGLTSVQRARVDSFLQGLPLEGPQRLQAREGLVALQAECDVFRYLEYLYPESTQHLRPLLLDVMFLIDSARAIERVRGSLTENIAEVRVAAIEILSRAGDTQSAATIARGLIDPELSVRIASAYAMANLNYREATPALIASLPHPDLRVSNSAKDSLAALWKDVIGDTRPTTVDEWTAVWKGQSAAVGKAVALDQLQPLADPAVPFVAG